MHLHNNHVHVYDLVFSPCYFIVHHQLQYHSTSSEGVRNCHHNPTGIGVGIQHTHGPEACVSHTYDQPIAPSNTTTQRHYSIIITVIIITLVILPLIVYKYFNNY